MTGRNSDRYATPRNRVRALFPVLATRNQKLLRPCFQGRFVQNQASNYPFVSSFLKSSPSNQSLHRVTKANLGTLISYINLLKNESLTFNILIPHKESEVISLILFARRKILYCRSIFDNKIRLTPMQKINDAGVLKEGLCHP